MARKNQQIKYRGKTRIAVVVDGETEFWYFQMLQRNERQLSVQLVPNLPPKKKKKLEDLYLRVLDLAKDYQHVFWVVDLDVVLKETTEHRGGGETPLRTLQRYRAMLEKKNTNVTVVYNQPCLEYWFLLHFTTNGGSYSACAQAENRLRKAEPTYDKSEQYFVRQQPDIYSRLRPHLSQAVSRSKMVNFDHEQPSRGFSELHKVFSFLRIE